MFCLPLRSFSLVSLDWGWGDAWISCPFLRFPLAFFDVPQFLRRKARQEIPRKRLTQMKSNEAIHPNMPIAIGFLGREV